MSIFGRGEENGEWIYNKFGWEFETGVFQRREWDDQEQYVESAKRQEE